jgi:hypothetical protein
MHSLGAHASAPGRKADTRERRSFLGGQELRWHYIPRPRQIYKKDKYAVVAEFFRGSTEWLDVL